jgi:apolipoprotein N-acyltransferase
MTGYAASATEPIRPLKISSALLLVLGAVLSFHLAYLFDACALLIGVFLFCLFRLCSVASARVAFYFGFAIGLAVYSPHLAFFWEIFGDGAIALWCVLSVWLGLFVLIGRACQIRLGPIAWAGVAPFVWTGLEYFRSELYYLRFSWLNPGYVFSHSAHLNLIAALGTYGIGFLFMAWAAFVSVAMRLSGARRTGWAFVLVGFSTLPLLLSKPISHASSAVNICGVQLEGSTAGQEKLALDGALKHYPQADLFVLSEYAFHEPVPQPLRDWCREHRKTLVAGGEEPISESEYFNTVFVVGPDGAIVFQQAKCIPVQFMKDGLPARDQHVWNSPWGKLGFGICYDASYTRVTDELIRQGAQALIFPTMDNNDWGKYEHELHARIAPMRAAEYAVPVFRLCSSGISQAVLPSGRVAASAPFPGGGALISARIELPERGRMPPDRVLGIISVAITLLLILWLPIDCLLRRRKIAQPLP